MGTGNRLAVADDECAVHEDVRNPPGEAELLAERGGLLLHAYGLIVDGMACAIIGPSGAGKSTAGNLMKKDLCFQTVFPTFSLNGLLRCRFVSNLNILFPPS